MPSSSSKDPPPSCTPLLALGGRENLLPFPSPAQRSTDACLINYRRAVADTPHSGGWPCLHVSLRDRYQGNIYISAERASTLWSPAVLKQES